ncbi:MAG: helix-turn-helix domain-containing protein [bacterium]|nr:helix-turn-helix domain-containing protein [bacterium]
MTIHDETRVSLREVAKDLDVTYQTVRRWTEFGSNGRVLEAYRFGRTWYTSREAVRRFAGKPMLEPETFRQQAQQEHRRVKSVLKTLRDKHGIGKDHPWHKKTAKQPAPA